MATSTSEELRDEVRRRYAESAVAVSLGSGGYGCGDGWCCTSPEGEPPDFGEALYDAEQRAELPDAAALASDDMRKRLLSDGYNAIVK